MVANTAATMSERRALLTDREREIVAGEADVTDSYRYQTISRVRARFDRLDDDLAALREHGDLLDELREIVCEDAPADDIAVDDSSAERDTHSGAETDDEREREPQGLDVETPPAPTSDPAREPEDDLASILDGWRPGRSREEREARLASAEAVLEYVREEGLVTRADLLEDVYPEHGVESQSDETWWRTTARGQIDEGTGRGDTESSAGVR
jgi:hypothetical protein